MFASSMPSAWKFCLPRRGNEGITGRTRLVNFIETVLVYKLPQCTREEIQTMIGLTDIDLMQTRFY